MEKKISKVKLLEGGLKGMEIEYLTEKKSDGRVYQVERKERRKVPVSGTLLQMFQDLDQYFNDIARVENSTVYGLKVTAGGFQLIGEVETGINNKTIHYPTPFITEGDEYASFENVSKKVEVLLEEVQKYMQGENKYSDRQLVMQFYEKKDKAMLADMEQKTEEEITEEAIKILEARGCLVMVPPDMEEKAEDMLPTPVVFGSEDDVAVMDPSQLLRKAV